MFEFSFEIPSSLESINGQAKIFFFFIFVLKSLSNTIATINFIT